MSLFKKIGATLATIVLLLVTTVFCLLFTAPGNQFIAYSANNLVAGLHIELKNGRFIYNDEFNITYRNNGIDFNAQQLKLNLYFLQCDGLCIDNLSAQSIALTLPKTAQTSDDTVTAPLEKIQLPFNIAIKNVAINRFELNHESADVSVKNFNLTAKLHESELRLKRLLIPDISIKLKQQTPSKQPSSSAILSKLPALPNINFVSPLDVVIEQFRIANTTILQNEQSYTVKNIAIQAQVKGAQVNVQQLAAHYQQWQLSTHFNGTLADNLPLTANIDVQNNENQLQLALNGSLSDLNLELTTQGQYPLTLTGHTNLQKVNYPFELKGEINSWSINRSAQILKIEDVALSATGNADDYNLNIVAHSQLDDYPQVTLNTQLTGGLTQAQLNTFNIKAKDSQATISAKVNWQNAIDVSFNGALNNLKAQYLTQAVTSDLSGEFNGTFNAQNTDWQLQMSNTELVGTVNQIPLQLASNLSIDNNFKANIDSFYLISGDSKLNISGQVDERWQLAGELVLQADKQANLPVIAQGNGHFEVTGERLTPAVALDFMVHHANFNDTSVQDVAIKGQLDSATNWQTQLSVKTGAVNVADQVIKSITVDAMGNKTKHQLNVALDAHSGELNLALNGGIEDTKWLGEITNLTVNDSKVKIANNENIAVMFNSKTGDFDVSAHCWATNDSRLCIDKLAQINNQGQLKATLNNLALKELQHLLPRNIKTKGAITADALVKWHAGALNTLNTHISSSDISATLISQEKRIKLPIETLDITASADATTGQLTARLASSVLGELNADVNISDIQAQQNLSGDITIDKVLLANLQPFIDGFEQFTGNINSAIALSGSVKEPLINGQLSIADIGLTGETLPISLQQSNINIAFDQTTATLTGQLNDQVGGSVELSGDIDWRNAQPVINVAVLGEQFFVRAQQGVDFKVSPDLNIGVANNALTLAGQVVVPYGRIMIEELPEGAVQMSDDAVIIDQSSEKEDAVPFDYKVDLKVIVKNDVKVESFGLESNVEGDLAIKMAQGTPILATGELNLVNGTYLAFGQDLVISTGQVGFSGSIEQPYLNIKAIRNPDNTADDVIAGITLTGNVEEPTLTVFSEPAMDQAQALAYLLNGQPLGEGESSSKSEMLTQLLLSQGVSRSEGVVSKVGETIGLSDVSLSSSGSGDSTKVEISGYIAPSLQVKYSVGVFDSLSEVAVRYQLLSQLYIEATSGLNQNLDILYKFDWN
ncbi:translocation/assembly module TamB domain-containing protein [Pseudoalteromonas sp. MMG010]|uniref:autotransporter assembly complex protein TamB n=1 Tax=Pseudoalteromonas sp. MMG010 TaxID=2822685 RepID=UPI001B39F21B|nr:translocation/assembly module TamB domain-containing protein [Pseudoalteromonas sp. MMG010]MBQ4831660.1 translocation/assembly module TamB domain-containing protein [Pseudoalteromonas sp. MMG010]